MIEDSLYLNKSPILIKQTSFIGLLVMSLFKTKDVKFIILVFSNTS